MNWHEALMNIKRSVNPGNVIEAWFEAIENRIAELEHSGHATLLREVEKDSRIAELETYIEDQTRVWLEEQSLLSDAHAQLKAQLAEAQKDAERWSSVTGYEGIYEVSSVGRLRSVKRVDSSGNVRTGGIINPSVNKKGGYLKVSLWRNNEKNDQYMHRIVAAAFCPKPKHCDQVNHIDGDTKNNEVSNLEWTTNAGNQTHSRRVLKNGVRPVRGTRVTDGYQVAFGSLQEAMEAGFKRANIQKCISGERKTHNGYRWKDEEIDAAMESEK